MMEYVVKGILNAHKIGKKRIFYIYDCDSGAGRARAGLGMAVKYV